MAIWAIPSDKIINYSKNGDDVDALASKTKYCLEAAFAALSELHTQVNSLNSSVSTLTTASGNAGSLKGIPLALSNPANGEILVYNAATNSFRNQAQGTVGNGQPLTIKNGDSVVGEYNGSSAVTVNLQSAATQSATAHDVSHLTRLVENLYLVLKVANLDPGGYDGLKCFTFYGNTNDLASCTAAIVDGRIICNGLGQVVVTKAISLGVACGHANLIVKHQNYSDVAINAEIALNGGSFATMTKTGTYPDSGNPNRATTQFTYSGGTGTQATLRLTFSRTSGASFSVDSFACTFNE